MRTMSLCRMAITGLTTIVVLAGTAMYWPSVALAANEDFALRTEFEMLKTEWVYFQSSEKTNEVGKGPGSRAAFIELEGQVKDLREAILTLQEEITELKTSRPESADNAKAPPMPQTVRAPFTVIDSTGRTVFKVGAGAGGADVMVGDPSGSSLLLSTGRFGSFLSLGAKGGASVQLLATPNNLGTLSIVNDGQTAKPAIVVAANGQGDNGMVVRNSKSATAMVVGVRNEDAGFAEFRDGSDRGGLRIGPEQNGEEMTFLRAMNSAKTPVVKLYMKNDSGIGRFLGGSGQSTGVTIGTDATESWINLQDAGAKPVAFFAADHRGGRLALTGPGGGSTAAKVSVDDHGGIVSVFSKAGGPARASIKSLGDVAVYNPDGTVVGLLTTATTGSGKLELMDASKNIVVAAGATNSGVGMVQAGPRTGGMASSIVGRK